MSSPGPHSSWRSREAGGHRLPGPAGNLGTDIHWDHSTWFRPAPIQAVGGPWHQVPCSTAVCSLQCIPECLTQLVNTTPDLKEKHTEGPGAGSHHIPSAAAVETGSV